MWPSFGQAVYYTVQYSILALRVCKWDDSQLLLLISAQYLQKWPSYGLFVFSKVSLLWQPSSSGLTVIVCVLIFPMFLCLPVCPLPCFPAHTHLFHIVFFSCFLVYLISSSYTFSNFSFCLLSIHCAVCPSLKDSVSNCQVTLCEILQPCQLFALIKLYYFC